MLDDRDMRILADLEQGLRDEDPRLARSLRASGVRGWRGHAPLLATIVAVLPLLAVTLLLGLIVLSVCLGAVAVWACLRLARRAEGGGPYRESPR